MASPARARRPKKKTTKAGSGEKVSAGLDKPAPLRHRRASIAGRPQTGPRTDDARVAQLVEHVTENHGVGGSIPSPGTIGLFATTRQSLKKPQKSAIYCIGLTADAR